MNCKSFSDIVPDPRIVLWGLIHPEYNLDIF